MSHMNESCHTWMSHVTHEWVMSQAWICHVTHMKESCHTWIQMLRFVRWLSHRANSEWVMSHTWMSHVTHMNESCHTHEWVMSHMNESPPDPINHLCSLTGKSISENHFTYRSVQILKIRFQGFHCPGSDPPHKIMRYWFYYSTQLGFWFPPDHTGLVEMICIGGVSLKKGISAGLALQYFYMIHRVGRCHT